MLFLLPLYWMCWDVSALLFTTLILSKMKNICFILRRIDISTPNACEIWYTHVLRPNRATTTLWLIVILFNIYMHTRITTTKKIYIRRIFSSLCREVFFNKTFFALFLYRAQHLYDYVGERKKKRCIIIMRIISFAPCLVLTFLNLYSTKFLRASEWSIYWIWNWDQNRKKSQWINDGALWLWKLI